MSDTLYKVTEGFKLENNIVMKYIPLKCSKFKFYISKVLMSHFDNFSSKFVF